MDLSIYSFRQTYLSLTKLLIKNRILLMTYEIFYIFRSYLHKKQFKSDFEFAKNDGINFRISGHYLLKLLIKKSKS